jgi:hypothetical protein
MEQVFVIASLGWLLPILFRIRHPRTQLLLCHTVLALCLILPLAEPWQHPVIHRAAASVADAEPAVRRDAAKDAVVTPVTKGRANQPAAAPPRIALTHPLPWTQIVLWILAAGFMARLA